jgi:2-(1,2-epoxy-1,2-dihydrophenyl)acetyl-CoA isomerase
MLPRAVGIKQALRIALSSKPLIAEEVFQLGLLAKLVPAGEVQQAGEAAATRLAGGPTLAYSATRKLMLDSFDRDFKSHLDAELTSFCRQAATSDFHGAVKAFFDRRKPEFRGR